MAADPANEPRIEGIKRFLRSSLVGIVATIVDVALLELTMRVFHWPDFTAKLLSLSAGVSTQFIGSRYFAFRAQAGAMKRQLKWFIIVEAIAFAITVGVFIGVRRLLALAAGADALVFGVIPAELAANLASGFIVYNGFSYPLWKRVFKLTPDEADTSAQKAPS